MSYGLCGFESHLAHQTTGGVAESGLLRSPGKRVVLTAGPGGSQEINTLAMQYEKHYNALVERAQHRGTKKKDIGYYTETHRILPGCLGGTYSKNNIALLTPEEHRVAHQLLVKIYSDEDTYFKILSAWNNMKQGRNNKRHGWLRRRYQHECKKRVGSNNPNYGRRWYHNPQTLENGIFVPGTEPTGWIRGRKLKPDNKCRTCNANTGSKEAKYCLQCRHNKSKSKNNKANKVKKDTKCQKCKNEISSKKAKYCNSCRTLIQKETARQTNKNKRSFGFANRKEEFLELYNQNYGSSKSILRKMGYNPNCANKRSYIKKWLSENR